MQAALQITRMAARAIQFAKEPASEFMLADERIDRLQVVIRAQSAGLELSTWAEVKASWE